MSNHRPPPKGQGAQSNDSGRYEVLNRVEFDDGWQTVAPDEHPFARSIAWCDDRSKSVISRNQSPDVPFDRSINPYRGCEHGCIYCFARPTHTWLGHSAGIDFERLLYAKRDAATLLTQELAQPAYRCKPIAIGVNTDAYQPLERSLRITRSVLQVLADCRHPVYLITKSSLIERDMDLLLDLHRDNLVTVKQTGAQGDSTKTKTSNTENIE
jgi:DNA repair photolyase